MNRAFIEIMLNNPDKSEFIDELRRRRNYAMHIRNDNLVAYYSRLINNLNFTENGKSNTAETT